MSGSGRKSQYRKTVTDQFLNHDVSLESTDEIVKVHGSRGSNIFEVWYSIIVIVSIVSS